MSDFDGLPPVILRPSDRRNPKTHEPSQDGSAMDYIRIRQKDTHAIHGSTSLQS